MGALLIINYDVTDEPALKRYQRSAGPVLGAQAQLVAMCKHTADLGEGGAPGERTAILRFDSREQAQAAYDSPAYQALLGERLRATRAGFAIIVDTIDG